MIVTKNILKRIFKKPTSYLLHFILPIALSIGMFAIYSSQGESNIVMALSDMDNSTLSQAVVSSIERTGKFDIITADRDEADQMVAEGDASFGYVIPEDFSDIVLNGESPEVKIIAVGQNEGTVWIKAISDYQIQNIVDMALAAAYDEAVLNEMLTNIETGDVTLETMTAEDITSQKEVTSSAMGMYLMVLMISTFTIAFMLLDEKRIGTYARIGMAPVNAKIYTLANILANMLIAAVQIAVVLLVMTLALDVDFFMHPLVLFAILYSFAVCAISLGLMLASFAKKMEVAGTLLSLVLAPSCMLAGCFWPVDYMPTYMKKVAYITPQRWTLDAIEHMQAKLGAGVLASDLSVVLAFALLFFLVAAFRFKTEEKRLG